MKREEKEKSVDLKKNKFACSKKFFLHVRRNVCNSRLCDRLRSSAIIWKQLSLRPSAICDLRSAIVCDLLRSYGNQPLNRINEIIPDFERKSTFESIKLLMNSDNHRVNKVVMKFISWCTNTRDTFLLSDENDIT